VALRLFATGNRLGDSKANEISIEAIINRVNRIEDQHLYAKVCAAYKSYPDGIEREKIRIQKEEIEAKHQQLKGKK
jgi:hypothetical protein